MYQKRNKELEILDLYLEDYSKQIYLREISALTKIPLKTTQNMTLALESGNILKSVVRGRNKYFTLNVDNPQTKLNLLQAEIYRTILFAQKYPAFKTFLKNITTNSPIIVFGSFARFTADKDSDADILIIANPEEKLPFHLLPYKIHEIRLSEESYAKALEKQETLLKEVEKHHVILNNHSFYINTAWGYYEK